MINRNALLTEIQQEKRFRKIIRALLENYLAEKKEKTTLEENRLRKIIQGVIQENISADVADEQPQRSTGINALRRLLKTIVPTIEDSYKELTTSKEQRDSFRAHILNAVKNSLAPTNVLVQADLNEENDLEEAEEDLEIKIDKKLEKFIPVRDKDFEEEEEEEEVKFVDIEGMDITGRNYASTTFNQIENQILDSYEGVAANKQDREEFEDYLLTNLKIYMDRFEEEIQPAAVEPESPDYSPDKDIKVDSEEALS